MRIVRPFLPFAAAALALGCAEVSAPLLPGRDYGIIQFPALSAIPVNIPEIPRAGVPLNVSVYTFGSSSCITPDGMDVVYRGNEVELTPWDLTSRTGACTDDLASHPHHAVLTFAQPGTVTLRIQGYLLQEGGTRKLGVVKVTLNVQ